MANPRNPGRTVSGTELPPVDPIDPEELRQIRLLSEAVLVSFTATPSTIAPFGRASLVWDVTMPTTVIPGVHVEVHLHWEDDKVVGPQGSQVITPYGDTQYSIYLRTPLATRQLGILAVNVDFGTCKLVDTAAIFFNVIVKDEADRALPPSSGLTLRGGGASIDIGINSFVVDIPLEYEIPNWTNAEFDVSLGFSVPCENGRVRVIHDFAKTNVSFGVLTGLATAGCSVAVANAIEAVSDAFLSGFIGPVIAERIAAKLAVNINENLQRLNNTGPPAPYRLYDLTLTEVGMTYRFCPTTPTSPSSTHPPLGGGSETDPI